MGSKEEASITILGDKYRSFPYDEATQWRHGSPPTSDINAVNKLLEKLPTKEWQKGSLEETVQNAIKWMEMEILHKTCLQDFKFLNPEKFKLSVNGRDGISLNEIISIGPYNVLLKNSLPEEFAYYKADEETFEKSDQAFRSAFPGGFACEVLTVYSGPPVITFKFRHWGYFKGPYKGHAATGKKVQFYGLGVLKLDKDERAEDLEIYYDPAELFGGLLEDSTTKTQTAAQGSKDASGGRAAQGKKGQNQRRNKQI